MTEGREVEKGKEGRRGEGGMVNEGVDRVEREDGRGKVRSHKSLNPLHPLVLTRTPHLVSFCKLIAPSSPSSPSPEHLPMIPVGDHPSLYTRTKQQTNKQTNKIYTQKTSTVSHIACTLHSNTTEQYFYKC